MGEIKSGLGLEEFSPPSPELIRKINIVLKAMSLGLDVYLDDRIHKGAETINGGIGLVVPMLVTEAASSESETRYFGAEMPFRVFTELCGKLSEGYITSLAATITLNQIKNKR